MSPPRALEIVDHAAARGLILVEQVVRADNTPHDAWEEQTFASGQRLRRLTSELIFAATRTA